MPSTTFPIRLDTPAVHVPIEPGGKLILRGYFHSTHDGSIVDAATTTWPSGAPGGASVDAAGLIDWQAGGFHLVSRDPQTHEVQLLATDGPAPACDLNHVQAPCLPLRAHHQALSRLMTVSEWTSSLKGGIQGEVVAPPVYAPVTTIASTMKPVLIVSGVGLLVLAMLLFVGWQFRRWSRSAPVELRRLAKRVRDKALRADPILSGPLAPALDSMIKAIDSRTVDPLSEERQRIVTVLRRVDATLDDKAAENKACDERKMADELVSEVEIALEAAGEAARLGPQR